MNDSEDVVALDHLASLDSGTPYGLASFREAELIRQHFAHLCEGGKGSIKPSPG